MKNTICKSHSLIRRLRSDLQGKNKHPQSASYNRKLDRRSFIRNSAILSTGLAFGSTLLSACNSALVSETTPKIAIIGGGIAGLYAQYLLDQQGLGSVLYESSGRLGGSIETAFSELAPNMPCELGGEYVSTDHDLLLSLAEEWGLPLIDMEEAPWIDEGLFLFEGRRYTYAEILAELEYYAANQFRIDMDTLPEYIESGNVHLWKLYDSISLQTYLKALDLKPWFTDLICRIFEAELGMPVNHISALTFMSLFDPDLPYFEPLGTLDKRFKIQGGSQQLIQSMLSRIQSPQELNHTITQIRRVEQGFDISIQTPNQVEHQHYKYIICAIPYAALRTVSLHVPLSEVRTQAIHELSYGNKEVWILGFNDAIWNNNQLGGIVHAGKDLSVTFRPVNPFESNTGSSISALSASVFNPLGLSREEVQKQLMEWTEVAFPGSNLAFNKVLFYKSWKHSESSQGSHSAFSVGQWTRFYGSETIEEGNLFFAGEHVSRVFQGTMNGALDTARIAVNSLLKNNDLAPPDKAL